MAIKISTTYSGRTDNTDPNYPYGKGRNVVGGVEGTGTPFEADWYNNLEGFLQGLLLEAGITPDGDVDNANSSQLVEAVVKITKNNQYNLSSLPPASSNIGDQVNIINRGYKLAYSDGVEWRFVSNDTIVA